MADLYNLFDYHHILDCEFGSGMQEGNCFVRGGRQSLKTSHSIEIRGKKNISQNSFIL